jgi:pimeloyl-ACP methyl ester carboxylesterase
MKFAHAHPELCKAVILGGCCNQYPPGVKSSLFFGLSAAVYDNLPTSTCSTFIQKLKPKHMSNEDLEFLMRTSMFYRAWKGCGNVMKEPEEGFYRKFLSTFDKPILMIHGSKDFRNGEEDFKKSGGKNFEMAVIEGADHMVLMDPLYKNVYGARVREFVEKVLKESQ